MCLPLAALSLVSAGVSAVGGGIAALSANAQANYRAKVAEQNAKLSAEAAHTADMNTREAALQQYRKIADMKGRQRVAAGANGVGIDFGTAGDVVQDTADMGREDVGRIYDQGYQKARGFEIEAANYRGEANAQRSAGTGALIKGAFDMGSTVLGGVQQYKKLKKDGY